VSTLPAEHRSELNRVLRMAPMVGGVALLVCIIGAPFSPQQFFRAYLAAYCFWLGIPLGSLSVLMIYHLTGGAWGFLIRRILEAATRTLPLMAILFVPIACGMALNKLYVWTDPAVARSSAAMRQKTDWYLIPWFFCVRAALFFVLWIALAYLLNTLSRRQDQASDERLRRWLARISGIGLAVYGVTITFASVDWVMSLQPAFRSTIFGPIFASGQILSGHAFALVVLCWLVSRPPLNRVYSKEAFIDLGSLQFTFLIIWSYVCFFQFMLVWIANQRYDSIWYLPRTVGGWQWVVWALFILHFVVPFFLLLTRDVKTTPRSLAQVAGLLLFMQMVFKYWQVEPAFADTWIGQHWMDFLTPFAIGGLWLANFAWEFRRYPVLPQHDASGAEAAHLHHLDQEQAAREEQLHHG
jgi:hypothetical protein